MLIEEPRESRNLVELYAARLQLRQIRQDSMGSRPRSRRASAPVVKEFGRQAGQRARQPLHRSSLPPWPPADTGDDYTSASV